MGNAYARMNKGDTEYITLDKILMLSEMIRADLSSLEDMVETYLEYNEPDDDLVIAADCLGESVDNATSSIYELLDDEKTEDEKEE